MNENLSIRLWGYLISGEGWSRSAGAAVRRRLSNHIDAHPPSVVRISMAGVRRMDASYASEGLVALIKSYLGARSICLTELDDQDIIDNIAAAAERLEMPVAIWNREGIQMVGPPASAGNQAALSFALARPHVRVAEFAQAADISSANASNKFKQLWQLGYLTRSGGIAASGGAEFVYRRIG